MIAKLVAALAVCAAVAGVAPAHADPLGGGEMQFLEELQDHGVGPARGMSSGFEMVGLGDTVCEHLRKGMSPIDAVATLEQPGLDFSGKAAAFIVAAAARSLCPDMEPAITAAIAP